MCLNVTSLRPERNDAGTENGGIAFRSRRACRLWAWTSLAPSPPAASAAPTPAWPAAPPAAPPGSPRWRLSAGSDRSLYPDPT